MAHVWIVYLIPEHKEMENNVGLIIVMTEKNYWKTVPVSTVQIMKLLLKMVNNVLKDCVSLDKDY